MARTTENASVAVGGLIPTVSASSHVDVEPRSYTDVLFQDAYRSSSANPPLQSFLCDGSVGRDSQFPKWPNALRTPGLHHSEGPTSGLCKLSVVLTNTQQNSEGQEYGKINLNRGTETGLDHVMRQRCEEHQQSDPVC